MTEKIESIGLIGLGQMGLPIARQLAKHFYVEAYDKRLPTLEQGDSLKIGSSLYKTVKGKTIVIMLLPSGKVVNDVINGESQLIEYLTDGQLLIDMGSSEPHITKALHKQFAEHGIKYVDAPVSGGVAKALTGELAVMIGGEPDAVEFAMPVFQVIGRSIKHVGGIGAGHTVKALNNLLSAIGLIATAEVASIANKMGVDSSTFIDVINASSGKNNSSETKFKPYVLSRSFDSGFKLALMQKDMLIALSIAHSVDVSPALGGAAAEIFQSANLFLDNVESDHTEVVKWIEHLANTKLS